MKSEEENFESIVSGKHQKINSTFHSHWESRFKEPEDFRKSKNWSRKLEKSKIEEVKD
jgi:hypothetical protein